MSAGDVEGFAAVAFPIVRRVFGGLIANEIVSVQPMSLPSGLIFFLDFVYDENLYKVNNDVDIFATAPDTTFNPAQPAVGGPPRAAQRSVYGGGVVGAGLIGGVELGGDEAEQSYYALNQGFTSPTGSGVFAALTVVANGVVGSGLGDDVQVAPLPVTDPSLGGGVIRASLSSLCNYDPDLEGAAVCVITVPGDPQLLPFNREDLISLTLSGSANVEAGTVQALHTTGSQQVRRLTGLIGRTAALATANPSALDPIDPVNTTIKLVVRSTGSTAAHATQLAADLAGISTLAYKFVREDTWGPGAGVPGSVAALLLALEGAQGDNANAGGDDINANSDMEMAEINIRVDSIAVTATTKKLKAKWSPELGQDLNAYHNLDAEVELTSILSEQIALEIDREIMNDLIQDATTRQYWSRAPGRFVNPVNGADVSAGAAPPDFTGNVSEWYETLVERINDVSAQIHRKTLRGGANFVVVSPEVANILEFTAGFRASVTADADKGTIGSVKVGALNSKFECYVDPYFPRNLVLVGRKGSSFLESGYVYAPYVPLQVTPTIFGTEDFVPRKGVMTRYAKQMVRPDMYGVVVVQDLAG